MKNKIDHKYDDSWYIVKRLFYFYVRPLKRNIIIALFCMIIIALTTSMNAWVIQPALDCIFVDKNHHMLCIIPIVIIVNSIINGVASFYESAIMKRTSQQIVSHIQMELYEHLMFADLKFLTQYPSGSLISRFNNDIHILKKAISEIFTGIIKASFTLIGLIGLMFYQSFNLTIFILLILPLGFYPVIQLGKRMKNISKGMQEELEDFTVRLDETLQNIKVIKSYCREEYEISRAKAIIDRFLLLFKKAAYVESASSPIMEIFGGLTVASVIFYGGMQAIDGNTTSGSFLSFIVALLLAYKPLKSLSKLSAIMNESLIVSKRLFLMLDAEPEIKIQDSQITTKLSQFDIQFANIFFSYQNNQNVLSGINISVKQGQTIALVGSSGAGKTTILNLLQRLYNVDLGTILIGGVDIKAIRLDVLRQNISCVTQDIHLFNDSIMDNIRYGRLNASNKDIIDASIIAGAHEFIIKLSDQYHTRVGQNGLSLSGGQKQRVSIARALLKNAPILLLDEATNALDSLLEKKVQRALEYLKRGKTTIIIAHRLLTIQMADNIFVLSNGKVCESGCHDELIANSREYCRLYNTK